MRTTAARLVGWRVCRGTSSIAAYPRHLVQNRPEYGEGEADGGVGICTSPDDGHLGCCAGDYPGNSKRGRKKLRDKNQGIPMILGEEFLTM